MSRNRLSTLRPPLTVLFVVSVVCAGSHWRALAESPASQPDKAPEVTGPITYFIESCSRCHGEIDSPYVGLTAPNRGDALNTVLQAMAEGPAAAPLDPAGLAEQRKLHDAIYDQQPYVWINPTQKETVSGETLPDTKLTLIKDGQATPVTVEENRFTLPPSPGATLRIERNGKTIERKLP
ncbi:MAG TPA: hypothetical protein VGB55_11070 [Tepidisphaeraceae bacterium]|jgi:hypothetical protein